MDKNFNYVNDLNMNMNDKNVGNNDIYHPEMNPAATYGNYIKEAMEYSRSIEQAVNETVNEQLKNMPSNPGHEYYEDIMDTFNSNNMHR